MKKRTKMIIHNTLRGLVVAFCLMVGVAAANAQVQVTQTIDSLQILIGEQTNVTLTVNLKRGLYAELPSFKPSQFIAPGLEVVSWKDKDTTELDNDMVQLQRVYTLTSFDEKVYAVPALKVKVHGKSYQGNPLALKVLTVNVDTVHINQFYPPKDVQNNPFQWSEWNSLFWLSVLLVLFCVSLCYLYIRLRQNKPIITHITRVKKIPAHDKALTKINEIKTKHLTNQEGQKEYYTLLTDTIREYIVSRFGFNAMEMTSSEIIDRLQSDGDPKMISELRELFTTADLVKFAKYETLINENDMNLVSAVKFIDETKTNEQVTEEVIVPSLTEDDKKTKKSRITIKAIIAVLSVISILIFIYVVYSVAQLLY